MSSQKLNLAQYLKLKRKAAGLRQTAVAKSLGYATSQFISNWERGLSQPPVNTLAALAKLYNISAEELFEVVVEENIHNLVQELNEKFKAVQGS